MSLDNPFENYPLGELLKFARGRAELSKVGVHFLTDGALLETLADRLEALSKGNPALERAAIEEERRELNEIAESFQRLVNKADTPA